MNRNQSQGRANTNKSLQGPLRSQAALGFAGRGLEHPKLSFLHVTRLPARFDLPSVLPGCRPARELGVPLGAAWAKGTSTSRGKQVPSLGCAGWLSPGDCRARGPPKAQRHPAGPQKGFLSIRCAQHGRGQRENLTSAPDSTAKVSLWLPALGRTALTPACQVLSTQAINKPFKLTRAAAPRTVH